MPALKMIRIFLAALLGLVITSLPVVAADSRVPMPEITKGKGDQCVEPTDDMRKNHMHYLLHKRDKTLRDGVRTKDYSLKECINCHAQKNDSGQYIPITDEGQFCQSCHSFASVKVDCFECHRTTPQEISFHPIVTPKMSSYKDVHEKRKSSEMLNNLVNNRHTTDE